MTPPAALRIKLISVLSLLCAGCAGDPFQTFYSPGYQNPIGPVAAYSGNPLSPATADPPIQYVQTINPEEAKSFAAMIAHQGYRRIGMSFFESNWPTPHNDEAAEMGRKLGADLVLYAVVPAGTRRNLSRTSVSSRANLTKERPRDLSGAITDHSTPTDLHRAACIHNLRPKRLAATPISSVT